MQMGKNFSDRDFGSAVVVQYEKLPNFYVHVGLMRKWEGERMHGLSEVSSFSIEMQRSHSKKRILACFADLPCCHLANSIPTALQTSSKPRGSC